MKFVFLLVLLTLTASAFAQHGGGHGGRNGGGHYNPGHTTPSHGGGHYNPGHTTPSHGGGYYNPGHRTPSHGGGHYNPGHYNPYPTTRSCTVVMIDHHNSVLNTFYGSTDYYTYRCDTALEQCFDEIRHRALSNVSCQSY